MADYTPEELKGLHEVSLKMAVMFDRFCKRNGLLSYMCGGGCIGAIRHQGFIPWDDDLDFFMPRKDFEKFLQIWNKQPESYKYKLVTPNEKKSVHYQLAALRDKDTTQIRPYQVEDDICHGVILDVIPIDGYAPGKWQRKLQCMWSVIYQLFSTQVIPQKHGKTMHFVGSVILGLVPFQTWRTKVWKLAKRQMTKYAIDDPNVDSITELCTGTHYLKKKYPKEIFASAIYMPFEDASLPIPVGYDTYLRTAFGDYTKLPPKEQQKPHHDAVFLDLKHGCERYKGIYYCTGGKKK